MNRALTCVVYKRGERIPARTKSGRIVASSSDAGRVVKIALEYTASRKGGRVLIKDGVVSVRNTSNIVLEGAGPGAMRLIRIKPVAIIHLVNVSNFLLHGLWLDGNSIGNRSLTFLCSPKMGLRKHPCEVVQNRS